MNFIHQKILEMRSAGKGIILASADLNELIALSDRILVMHKGRGCGILKQPAKGQRAGAGTFTCSVSNIRKERRHSMNTKKKFDIMNYFNVIRTVIAMVIALLIVFAIIFFRQRGAGICHPEADAGAPADQAELFQRH